MKIHLLTVISYVRNSYEERQTDTIEVLQDLFLRPTKREITYKLKSTRHPHSLNISI